MDRRSRASRWARWLNIGRARASASHGRRSNCSFGFESLEPRTVLAAQFLISEFMASNTVGILDQDGHLHDWIEVQNVGDSAGNLQGYYLTDNRNDLQNWDFPSTPIAAGGFVRVFASG